MAVIKRYAHINQASNDSQNKLDAADAYVTGSLHAGNTDIAGTIAVSGATTLADTLSVAKAATLSDSLSVAKAATLSDTLSVAKAATLSDTLSVAKAATLSDSLSVAKAATLSDTLSVAKAATLSDTLSVAKAATLSDTLSVTKAATLSESVSVAGVFNVDAIDANLDVDLTAHKIVPAQGSSYDLGANQNNWANIYTDALHVHTVSAEVISASVGAELQELHVLGDAHIDGTLDVTQKATFADAADVNGKFDAKLGKFVVDTDVTVKGAKLAVQNGSGTEKFYVAASSGDVVSAGDVQAQTAHIQGAGFALEVTNSASFGAVRVFGDLVVDGDQVILNTSVLQIEDYNITLVSGSHTDSIASGAGLTIQGDTDHNFMWKYHHTANNENGFVINDNWLPSDNNAFDLGMSNKKWRNILLSGDAGVGGDLSVAGAASVGALDASSLAVAGAATFGVGIAVTGTGSFSGAIDAASATFAGALSADSAVITHSLQAETASFSGDLSVTGNADLNGTLSVAGAADVYSLQATDFISAGGDLSTAANLSVGGDASVAGALSVTGASTLTTVTATDIDASTLDLTGALTVAGLSTFNGNAVFNGTATFNNTFAVPGTGSFGALVVKGVDLSPISASCTTNADQKDLFSFSLNQGELLKLEVEVLAGGAAMGDVAVAGFKYSIICGRDPNGNNTAAIELAKEVIGASGPKLDVALDDATAGTLKIKADGSQVAHDVRWSAQVVKKMKMSMMTGAVIEDRI